LSVVLFSFLSQAFSPFVFAYEKTTGINTMTNANVSSINAPYLGTGEGKGGYTPMFSTPDRYEALEWAIDLMRRGYRVTVTQGGRKVEL
jgi:hypothetical protein